MFSDFTELLWCVLPGAAIGLIVGYGLHLRYPKEMAESAEQDRRLPWWAFGLFALMFAGLATFSACEGRWSFAIFFVLFALLQVGAAVMNHFHPPTEHVENKS